MSCSVAALEFAYKRLAAISVLTGLEAAEIYDCFYERARHALLLIHAFVPRPVATDLEPLLDLLTSLHVGAHEPVASGVLSQQGHSIQAGGRALDKEVGVILASKVQLAIILPLGDVPETRAARILTELLRDLGEDPGLLVAECVCLLAAPSALVLAHGFASRVVGGSSD